MINWAFFHHYYKEEKPIQIVQDYHARSPEPAIIDENAGDSNSTQLLPAAPVISSPDLSDNEPTSSSVRPATAAWTDNTSTNR